MQDVFNYLAIAVSIIVGISMTYILNGFSKVIKYRANLKIYWLHIAWAVLLLLLLIQYWWGFWRYQRVEAWTFPMFAWFLLAPVFLLVASDLIFPDIDASSKIDIRDYYYRNHRFFFGIIAIYFMFVIINLAIVQETGGEYLMTNIIRLAGVIVPLIAMWSKSERVHIVLLVLGYISFVAFVISANIQPLAILDFG